MNVREVCTSISCATDYGLQILRSEILQARARILITALTRLKLRLHHRLELRGLNQSISKLRSGRDRSNSLISDVRSDSYDNDPANN